MYNKECIQELWNKIVTDQDREAYNRFFDYYYPRLFKFSLHFVKLPSIAQEVVSDVVYNILKDKSRMYAIDNINGYLFKAVRNKSLHRLNGQNRKLTSQSIEEVQDYLVQQPQQHEIDTPHNDELQRLKTVVKQLPKQRQMVYRLIREEGLTINEVSEILSISERTVEKHLELAITGICLELKEYLQNQRQHPKIRKLFPRSS